MKKLSYILFIAIFLISCDRKNNLDDAKAFAGDYWMETTNIGIINGEESPLNEKSTWTPVSIYEKSGKWYVQTELLGSPDFDNEHPKEAEGTRERPDFIAPYRLLAEEGDTLSEGIENIENIVDTVTERLVCINGYIVLISHGVRNAQTLPIKVKSSSETVLNLESYKPVEVMLTDATGEPLCKIHAWYEYGSMVKNDETITWDVDYKDDYTPSGNNSIEYDRVVHRNILYKR